MNRLIMLLGLAVFVSLAVEVASANHHRLLRKPHTLVELKNLRRVHNHDPLDAKKLFDSVDLNHDGVVDSSELDSYYNKFAEDYKNQELGKLDKNGDGLIQPEEFDKSLENSGGVSNLNRNLNRNLNAQQDAEKLFKSIDTNNNGVLDADEINAYTKKLFAGFKKGKFEEVDKNRDGLIQPGEFDSSLENRHLNRHLNRNLNSNLNAQERAQKRFNDLDLNHDGVLDANEIEDYFKKLYEAYKNQELKKLDKNGDGKIQPEEFDSNLGNDNALNSKEAEKIFKSIDTNNDGVLDQSEIDAHFKDHYEEYKNQGLKKLDKNGDGKIQPEEFDNTLENRSNRVLGDRHGNHRNLNRRLDRNLNRNLNSNLDARQVAENLFKSVDTNNDGVLDPEEIAKYLTNIHVPHPIEDIKKMDKNGDGKIQPEEFDNTLGPHSRRVLVLGDRHGSHRVRNLNRHLNRNEDARQTARQRFNELDLDHDGVLNFIEIENYLKNIQDPNKRKAIKKMDKNGNGLIEPEEFDNTLRN